MYGGRFRPPLGVCGIAGFAGRCKHRALRMQGKALPGFAGYLWGKAAMHPSVCALRRIHLPLQGRLLGGLPLWKAPLQGELSPQVTEGCIAAVWGRCPINASATLRDHGFALLRFRQNFTAYRCKLCVDFCIGKPQHINMDGI